METGNTASHKTWCRLQTGGITNQVAVKTKYSALRLQSTRTDADIVTKRISETKESRTRNRNLNNIFLQWVRLSLHNELSELYKNRLSVIKPQCVNNNRKQKISFLLLILHKKIFDK